MSLSKDTPTSEKYFTGAVYQPTIGETIAKGRYKTLEFLGHGGMGQVYKATDTVLDRLVAIKLLNYGKLEGKVAVRFQQEAKALSNLTNDGILSVFDFGLTDDGFPFMVTEFVQGETLRSHLDKVKQLGTEESIAIAIQISQAMAHAHKKHIVHRDLKPENLILAIEGDYSSIKILDFGISKALDLEIEDQFQTPSGQIVGSPKYLSPEQATNEKVDYRSDIYSLGCILFECLTGYPPYLKEDSLSTIDAHLHGATPKLSDMNSQISYSDKLEELISKCLQKSPKNRYQSMNEFKSRLEEVLAFEQEAKEEAIEEVESDYAKPEKKETNKIAIGFIVALLTVASIAVLYLIANSNQNSIGEIQSQEHAEKHEKLDVSKSIAQTSYKTVIKDRQASFKSWDEQIPITALSKLKKRPYDIVEFKNSTLEKGMITELSKRQPRLPRLVFYECSIDSGDISAINNFKNLQSLYVKNCNLNDQTIALLKPRKKLQSLSLEKNFTLTRNSLEHVINAFPNLYILDIAATSVKPADFILLKKLPRLRELELKRLKLQDKDLKVIAQLPRLTMLDIGNNDDLTIKALKLFSKHKGLTIKVKDLFLINDKELMDFKAQNPSIKIQDFDTPSNALYRERIKQIREQNHI